MKARIKASDFGEKAEKHPDGDEFLLRCLRATMKHKNSTREFQVEQAFERTRNVLDFKYKYNVFQKPDHFEEFRKVYPRFAYKDTSLKKVLLFTRMGEFVTHAHFNHFSELQWQQSIGFEMESVEQGMRELANEAQVENRGYYAISDCKGLGLGALSQKKATIFLANVSGENYPEMIEKVYLINVPWIFEKIYGMVKPLLDPHTVSKFHMFSGIPPEFKTHFNQEQLPKEFGGKSEKSVPYPLDCGKKYDEKLINYDVVVP